MNPPVTETAPSQFESIAERYTLQIRNGESPQIADYVQQFPKLESMITRLFPLLDLMESSGSFPEDLSSVASFQESLEQFASSPVGKQLGEFTILREIGRGGMGIVYLAHQKSLDRQVALKLVSSSAQFDERRRLRFQEEARASAMLHHTNIVPVFDIGRYDDFSYIVMQYIEAVSLSDLIKHNTGVNALSFDENTATFRTNVESTDVDGSSAHPLPDVSNALDSSRASIHPPELPQEMSRRAEWTIQFGIQIAEALQHAHSKGILHRDIKPSNLLVDEDGNAWVSDFGLAKTVNSPELTQTGEIVGTLRYMSPEQMNGKPDRRSDIFGLGLTLYELVGQKPAYDATSREQLIQQIVVASPPSLRTVAPEVPLDLATVIEKAIDQDPDRRYSTAGELAEELRRIQNGEPILARRVGLFEKAWKWCQRNSLVASLFAGLVVLFTSCLAGFAVHSKIAHDANLEMKEQFRITKEALQESRRQSKLSLNTLSNVIDDYSSVFNYQGATRAEVDARQRMTRRVLEGLQNVGRELKHRNDYGKTLIWAHLDIAELYLRIGGESFANAEHLAESEYQLALDKTKKWLQASPTSRAAKEVYSETRECYGRKKFFEGDSVLGLKYAMESIGHYEEFVRKTENDLNWEPISQALTRNGFTHKEIVDFVDNNYSRRETQEFKNRLRRETDIQVDDMHKIRTDTRDRRTLMSQYNLVGLIHFRNFRLDQAIRWYDKTLKLAETSKKLNPLAIAQPQKDLIRQIKSHRNICRALPQIRKDRNHALQFDSDAPRMLYDCAAWQAFDGDHVSASRTLEFVYTLDNLRPQDHYSNACGYGRCIKALVNTRDVEELSSTEYEQLIAYRKQAMKCLRLADDGGLFKQDSMVGLMGRDHDLDPIRDRTEFQKFFKGVVARRSDSDNN